MSQYVSMKEVVSEAISVVGTEDEEVIKAFAPQWIWRAIADLPITEDQIEICSVTAKNFLIKKPAAMKKFLELALYDENDCYVPHVFHSGRRRIFPTSIHFPRVNALNCEPVDVSESDYNFEIGTNGACVSYAKIRFFAYPIDSDGMPKIKEDDVMACIYKIRYMASMRKNDNQSEIAANKFAYEKEADRARAKRKASNNSVDKMKTIGAMMNRFIPDFNRSKF